MMSSVMIKSFCHKGIQKFFEKGVKAGIQTKHAMRLRLQLSRLDDAKEPKDMNPLVGNCIHSKGI